MGQISMATRDELVGALATRYVASDRKGRGRILDELVAVSGLHRKRSGAAWQSAPSIMYSITRGELYGVMLSISCARCQIRILSRPHRSGWLEIQSR